MKSQTISLAIVELFFDNGKSEVRTMSKQQFTGLKKSKIHKTILTKQILAKIDVRIKHITNRI